MYNSISSDSTLTSSLELFINWENISTKSKSVPSESVNVPQNGKSTISGNKTTLYSIYLAVCKLFTNNLTLTPALH